MRTYVRTCGLINTNNDNVYVQMLLRNYYFKLRISAHGNA